MPSPSSPSVPENIGNYKVIRPIGQGLMGGVYMGKKDQVIDAVKLLDPTRAKELPQARRFEGEDIFDPYLVRYKEIGYNHQNHPFLVFNYLQVSPLSQDKMPARGTAERIEFFATMARTIGRLHQEGLAHGNLKPSNVLIRQVEGEVEPYISDIGLDYVYHPENFSGANFFGTFPYMAPEKIASYLEEDDTSVIHPPGDVYSLGTLLFEFLSGRRMFLGSTSLEEILEHKKNRVESYKLIAVTFPRAKVTLAELNQLIYEAMAFSPDDRPPIGEFIERLEACVITEAPSAPPSSDEPETGETAPSEEKETGKTSEKGDDTTRDEGVSTSPEAGEEKESEGSGEGRSKDEEKSESPPRPDKSEGPDERGQSDQDKNENPSSDEEEKQ